MYRLAVVRPTIQRRALCLAQRRFQSSYEERYGAKIKQKLNELGVKDITEFKTKNKDKDTKPPQPESIPYSSAQSPGSSKSSQPRKSSYSRKDTPPITPLSDIMDITRILKTPHTAEQVGALWTAYHAKKSSEGKGFLSAAIPRATYEAFLSAAKKYPSFILPLPRPEAQIEDPKDGSSIDTPYEFYFMEWGHYSAPPVPSTDLFTNPKDTGASPNPPCTTVIFTPLQEYKLRQAYALPHLVLTHYTDLAHTHDVVLMRGELTPSPNGAPRFLLSPPAAQLLAFGLQRFYLQAPDTRQGKLLSTFHERPQDFSWEELISASQI